MAAEKVMTTLTVRVDEKLVGKARAAAKAEGKTYSDWFTDVLSTHIKAYEKETGKRLKAVAPRAKRPVAEAA